jgi:hypothetical protein
MTLPDTEKEAPNKGTNTTQETTNDIASKGEDTTDDRFDRVQNQTESTDEWGNEGEEECCVRIESVLMVSPC